MNARLLALLCLIPLSSVAAIASAQQADTPSSLFHALQSVAHAHPGLANGILGSHTGALISKAEALAKNTKKTKETKAPEPGHAAGTLGPVTFVKSSTPGSPPGLQRARYKDVFSGRFKLQLPGMTSASYAGIVTADGPPDFKIQSYQLNIGGWNSGWVLAQSTNAGSWIFDKPVGHLRIEVTISTPGGSVSSGGAATLMRFGTFIASYTFSTTNSMKSTPLGPRVGDKITMVANGTTYVTHLLQKTADPVSTRYPGTSLDVLGIRPGMNVDAVKRQLISFYKSAPRSTTDTVALDYRNIIVATSQPYISSLTDHNKSGTDQITVQFGNEATGDTVISVERTLTFSADTGPKFNGIRTALEKKYGVPTTSGGADQPIWLFGQNDRLKSCPRTGCSCSADLVRETGSSLATEIDDAKEVVSTSGHACVEATISRLLSDNLRASQLVVLLSDPADVLLNAQEARRQMYAAAVADYKKIVKPEKVPTL